MTPKEKAEELFDKFMFSSIYFTNGYDGAKLNAKTCVLMAVNLRIGAYLDINNEGAKSYWEEVKQEIESL